LDHNEQLDATGNNDDSAVDLASLAEQEQSGGDAGEGGEPEASATEADSAAEEKPGSEPAAEEPDDGMNWYVIHTYSGYERKVKQSLEERIRTLELGDQVAELLIPTEDIVEMKAGKKVVTAKKFFPGYLLIRMAMNDRLWHVVKNTPRVTGFVGSGRKPIPLPQHEVDKIVNRMEESVEAPKPKFQFRKGESVRIIDGPFTNFTGKVDEVDTRRNTLKVMVSIFGRNTPVELDFFQVEKV
jgi:transcriptional antiterminator NusG